MSVAALTELGSVLGDTTRSTILVTLMDGRAWTVTELAHHSGVARSTASEHLSLLLDAGLAAAEARGRHRYFRLADQDVAKLLESLGSLRLPAAVGPRPDPRAPAALRHARSCYDHLAGWVAVTIYDQLHADGHLVSADSGLAVVTSTGRELFASLGLDLRRYERSRRPLIRSCLDWTERRHHLAGTAGAALFSLMLDRCWIRRGPKPRSIMITDAGTDALSRVGLLREVTARRRDS